MREPQTPLDLGFYMPAEWSPHAGTQMHWPSNMETWPGRRMEQVEKVYLEIISVLHRHEPVHLLVSNRGVEQYAKNCLGKHGVDLDRIVFHRRRVNDVWARDCGPIFIKSRTSHFETWAIIDWEYNAWGGKYPPWEDDNTLPRYFADSYGIDRFRPGMVLEGGSIEVNGEGVLLTTESVLLNSNRNPHLDREEIEWNLKQYLGVEKVIWLKEGLHGDDTDGHIDDLARFLNPETILAVESRDPLDVNHRVLKENLEILEEAVDQNGEYFTIETLPLPETITPEPTADGSPHVPASYANFYIANGVVLVPLYDDRYDEEAMELFRRYFPDREVAGIPCRDLVWGQGSIHCITQQLYWIAANSSKD